MPHINVSKRINRETGSSSSVAETLCDALCLGAAVLLLIDTGDSIIDSRQRRRETNRFIEKTEKEIEEIEKHTKLLQKRREAWELSQIPEDEVIEADYQHV